MRWWALLSSGLAPVFLIGGWTLAANRQPAGYDATRDTISALAGLGATDRWVMTVGLVGLGLCHVVTALGLGPIGRVRPEPVAHPVQWSPGPGAAIRARRGMAPAAGRVLLAAGGVATLMVAAFPVPRTGSSAAHAVAAFVAFGALTLWPAFTRVPTPWVASSVTCVLAGLLTWFGAELVNDGPDIGTSERILAAAQSLWPFCVTVALARASRKRPHAARNVRR